MSAIQKLDKLKSDAQVLPDFDKVQTCLQCYRKTVAPMALKCQHFICLSCITEQLAISKSGIYREYKCKVCGLFTDMSHLKKVFIDNEFFNVYNQNQVQADPSYKPPEETQIMKELREADAKMSGLKRKRIFLDEVNVANLNQNANNLLNTLHMNKESTQATATITQVDMQKKAKASEFIDVSDYSKCLVHSQDYVYMDKDTFAFYCVDCVTDVNININKENLVKLKKDSGLIKDKAKEAVHNISKLRSRIENNIRTIANRLHVNDKYKQELNSIIESKFRVIYHEIEAFKALYTTKITHELQVELKNLKFEDFKHQKLLGFVTVPHKNLNHVDTYDENIANIVRWRKISQEVLIEDLTHKKSDHSVENKVNLDITEIVESIKNLSKQVSKETYSNLNLNLTKQEAEREIAKGNFAITKEQAKSMTPSRKRSSKENSEIQDESRIKPLDIAAFTKRKASGTQGARTPTPTSSKTPKSKLATLQQLQNGKSLLGESKFFGNMFGETIHDNFFDEQKDSRGKIKTQGKSSKEILDSMRPKSPGKVLFEDEAFSPKKSKSPSRPMRDDDYFGSGAGAAGVTREQFLDMLMKTSDIARKYAQFRQGFITLTVALPLTTMSAQNLKTLFKYSSFKPGTLKASLFHKLVDGQGPYLGLVSHSQGMFGFFIENDMQEEFEVYCRSELNFIFCFQSPHCSKFTTFKIKQGKENYALCNTEDGFCMGMPTPNNRDLYLNFDDITKCSSCLGYAYDNPDSQPHILAGKYTNWNIHEIEIIQIVTKNTGRKEIDRQLKSAK